MDIPSSSRESRKDKDDGKGSLRFGWKKVSFSPNIVPKFIMKRDTEETRGKDKHDEKEIEPSSPDPT